MSDTNRSEFIVHSKLDDLPLSPIQFRFYAHAVRRAGLGGIYYESVPNAAKHCQVRDNTIRAARERCTALGLLKLLENPPGRTWTYRVNPVEEWNLPTPSNEDPGPALRGSNEAPGPPQKELPHPLKRGPGTPSNEAPQRYSHKGSLKGNPKRGEPPPSFEPVKRGLYRREYEAMLDDARKEIKAIKANPENYARDLTPKAQDLIDFLTGEKGPDWERRVREVRENPEAYERSVLKPGPAATVDAWKARIHEIRNAMNGVKP